MRSEKPANKALEEGQKEIDRVGIRSVTRLRNDVDEEFETELSQDHYCMARRTTSRGETRGRAAQAAKIAFHAEGQLKRLH